jgi:twitching motility two-component system response regulator PilG
MEANLKNPYKLLQLIAEKDLTGCLSISSPQDSSITWQLYVGGSRIYFATASGGGSQRIHSLLQQMSPALPLPILGEDKSEYESLYEWYVENHISLTDFRRILLNLSREALIQGISHNKAQIKFEQATCIKPVLIAAPLTDLIKPVSNHVKFWQNIHNYIPSPFSQVYLDPNKVRDFKNFWHNANQNRDNESNNTQTGGIAVQNVGLSVWLKTLEQKHSIYEICSQFQLQTHVLSQWFSLLIEEKILEVCQLTRNLAIASESPVRTLIACIDDSHTVQRQVKMVLEMSGFDVLGITDSSLCLTALARQRPALILMDITMPEIDGYELCKMLRQSRHMRNVPIIMFTGKDGLIDRMRAQLVGANDYITKPVNAEKLIAKVQGLIHSYSSSIHQLKVADNNSMAARQN